MQQTNSSEHCPDKGQPNKKHSDQIVATTDWITVPVWIFFLVGGALAFVAHYYVNERSVRIKFFTDAMLASSVGIIAVIQTIFYSRQTKTLDIQEGIFREQSELMKEALVISKRAYVGVHSILEEWEKQRIILTIENTGHVPAEWVKVFGNVIVLRPKGGLTFQFDTADCAFSKEFGRTRIFHGNLKARAVIDLDRLKFVHGTMCAWLQMDEHRCGSWEELNMPTVFVRVKSQNLPSLMPMVNGQRGE